MAVQARIRLLRSFDERHHNYQGYMLRLDGICGEKASEFMITVGKAAHEKHQFRAGMKLNGWSVQVDNPRLEVAGYYKTSRLRIEKNAENIPPKIPPFLGIPPGLQTHWERGHRRLDAKTYSTKCTTCIWGCKMPIEIIVDHWNPSKKKYCFETFCYGPKSCSLYKAGATRKVPGRNGTSWEEEDWVDEGATSHRGMDD